MITVKDIKTDITNTSSIKAKREALINATNPDKLPTTYQVNETAHKLHPNIIKAVVKDIVKATDNIKIITFKAENAFPPFKAGTFVTLSLKMHNQVITRPYSIYSSIKEANNGILKLGIQSAGILSNYVNNELKVGTPVLISEPSGDFYHDDIRDSNHILALAGGSGVTPFVSMMKSIQEGSEDFSITLLYGVKSKKDLMFNINEFNDPRIEIIPILSNEEVANYEHGFINANIIKKYLKKDSSIFVCGPDVMYQFVKEELKKLNIDLNKVRFEHNCAKDLKITNPNVYTLTVHMRGEIYKIKAQENETLLIAMEKANLLVPSRCRSGLCGFCHSRLIKGSYKAPKEYEHRRLADYKFNYIHPCSTYPTSDIEIDVPPFDELKEL